MSAFERFMVAPWLRQPWPPAARDARARFLRPSRRGRRSPPQPLGVQAGRAGKRNQSSSPTPPAQPPRPPFQGPRTASSSTPLVFHHRKHGSTGGGSGFRLLTAARFARSPGDRQRGQPHGSGRSLPPSLQRAGSGRIAPLDPLLASTCRVRGVRQICGGLHTNILQSARADAKRRRSLGLREPLDRRRRGRRRDAGAQPGRSVVGHPRERARH